MDNQGTQPTAPATPPAQPTPTPQASRPSSGLISPNKIYEVQNGPNLMHPVTVASVDPPRNGWKMIVLDVLTVVGAALFGYCFSRYLDSTLSPWYTLGTLFFWGAMSVLEGFLAKDITRRFVVIVFESILLIAFFSVYAWQVLLITVLIMMACLLWGYISGRRDLRNGIEVRFFTTSGKVAGKVITAAVIFMVVMYASLANDNGNFFVSQGGFSAFFNWTSGFVSNFYPSVPLNGTLGEFSQAVAQAQLQNNPMFESLPPAEKNAALAQSSNQIARTFSGMSPSSTAPVASTTLNEPTSNAFYNYISSLIKGLQDRFGDGFLVVWGLVLFLAIRSIAIIAVWLTQFVSLIFYEILLASGFMKIVEQSATKEVIEY